MPRTKTGTVYALIDPRDDTIRYIGKTEQPILTRLSQHLAQPTNPAMRVWINSLGVQGMTPRVETVTTAPLHGLGAEEQRQIRHHAKAGHRLLNSPYYHAHLDDLSGPHVAHHGNRPEEQRERPDQRVALWLYGGLARSRAAGNTAAWVAALIVVASAPVYLALLLLRPLLTSKAGIRSLVPLIFGWICWESGFDKAVRDLVLARLPLHEWSGLWASYGAGPANTLVADLTWPCVITTLFMTCVAYSDVAERFRSN